MKAKTLVVLAICFLSLAFAEGEIKNRAKRGYGKYSGSGSGSDSSSSSSSSSSSGSSESSSSEETPPTGPCVNEAKILVTGAFNIRSDDTVVGKHNGVIGLKEIVNNKGEVTLEGLVSFIEDDKFVDGSIVIKGQLDIKKNKIQIGGAVELKAPGKEFIGKVVLSGILSRGAISDDGSIVLTGTADVKLNGDPKVHHTTVALDGKFIPFPLPNLCPAKP